MIRVVVLCMLLARVASAEDIVAYEAEGEAAANATDAKGDALDDAFAHAVQSALAELVPGDARTAHQGDLDREIVGHARLWVKGYSVMKDETDDDRRELTVSVRIDRDKLRARLDELKIPTKVAGASDATADTSGARTATIVLRVARGGAVHASFGKGAERDLDGLDALASRLHGAGYAIRRAPDDGPAPTAAGDLPDVDADALAESAQADVAAVAGVTVGDPAFVRGQAQQAVLATAHVRLLDHKAHQMIGQGAAVAAAAPDDAHAAIDRALAAATADAIPHAATQLGAAGQFSGDDQPIAEPGTILVRMSPKTPYAMVLEEQRYLAGAKGVHAATLRRLSPAGWVIGVATSDPIERVAQIAKKPPASDASSTVKIAGTIVEVTLTGAP
ncbi:MAG TPA: hypothetical protein VGL61_35520 [Kofleriaceae bacterium]